MDIEHKNSELYRQILITQGRMSVSVDKFPDQPVEFVWSGPPNLWLRSLQRLDTQPIYEQDVRDFIACLEKALELAKELEV